MNVRISISNRQTVLEIGSSLERLFRRAIRCVFADAPPMVTVHPPWRRVEIDLAIVDDAMSREVNAEFLRHDYATDVISFALDDDGDTLISELVVNAEFAIRRAPEYSWLAQHELLLYAVHGSLHLIGLDDHSPADVAAMRAAERHVLERFIHVPPESATG